MAPSSKQTIRDTLTWQVVVFPSLAAFFLLAAYGFYLIFHLVGDVHRIADAVEINMDSMAGQMQRVSANLDELTGSVRNISVNLDDLTGTIKSMGDTLLLISANIETLPPMLTSLDHMTTNTRLIDEHIADINQNIGIMNGQVNTMIKLMGSMTAATHHMTQGVSGMNQNIGRPMTFMNSFMPW
jgi:methyl-accepting chemotaxis protein